MGARCTIGLDSWSRWAVTSSHQGWLVKARRVRLRRVDLCSTASTSSGGRDPRSKVVVARAWPRFRVVTGMEAERARVGDAARARSCPRCNILSASPLWAWGVVTKTTKG